MGSTLRVLAISGTAIILGTAAPALAQMPGSWVGTTSHGGNLQFQVREDGTVGSYSSDLLITCESGSQDPSQIGVNGAVVPIVDQSFDDGRPPQEFAPFAWEFAGTFDSNTAAAGTFGFIRPRFRILDDGVSSQLCQDNLEWTATWQGPVPPPGTIGVRPSPGDEVITYSKAGVSISIVEKTSGSK